MYHANQALAPALSPADYVRADVAQRERERVLAPGWHFVATTDQLTRPGQFITATVYGQPVQVRHDGGRLVALSNVCAHRHCLLTSDRAGCSPTLRCQYHGWEYDATGQTRKIPRAKDFAPIDRDSLRLATFPVATLGQLVFVQLDPSGPALTEQLGEIAPFAASRFDADWELVVQREFDFPANWKVAVENTLEAYHVPYIHPGTFKEDPGEQRSEHRFTPTGSALVTRLPFAPHSRLDSAFQHCEGAYVRWALRQPATGRYEQYHAYPNLLFSWTDTLSLMHQVVPTGPTTARSLVALFGRRGRGWWRRPWSWAWNRAVAPITLAVLREDRQLYPAIQQGLAAATGPGTLGRCEERIHAFQLWLARALQSPDNGPSAAIDGSPPQPLASATLDGAGVGTPLSSALSQSGGPG